MSYRGYLWRRLSGGTERAVERRSLYLVLLLDSGDLNLTVLLLEEGESSLRFRRLDLDVRSG